MAVRPATNVTIPPTVPSTVKIRGASAGRVLGIKDLTRYFLLTAPDAFDSNLAVVTVNGVEDATAIRLGHSKGAKHFWIEISGNEMYSLPCLSLDEFKKLFGNKLRPMEDDDFKKFLQGLTNEELDELRDSMARNIAPGNEKIYR